MTVAVKAAHDALPPPNKSLDASGTSGLVIDNLSVTQLFPAASTQPLDAHNFENSRDAMTTERTSATKNRWLWIIPAAIIVLVLNVGIHILYMVAYSYVINPGQDAAHYQAHAQVSAPYSSIVVGMPLMFLVCRWVGRRFAARFSVPAALLVWLAYWLIDVTVLVFAGELHRLALLFVISFVTKFAAAYLGGLGARKQVVRAME